ncbi:MAG: hypothetical protein WEE64_12750 [Dehalococcoidia bacterium]
MLAGFPAIKDGLVNSGDLGIIVSMVGGPGFCLPPTVSIPRNGCPASDVNKNGIVSVSDIGEVVMDFGAAPLAAPAANPNTDVDGDGFVSVTAFGTFC